MAKGYTRYWEAWTPEATPKNPSSAYNPCREGHSDERTRYTDWMQFTYEICTRCGRRPWSNPLTKSSE